MFLFQRILKNVNQFVFFNILKNYSFISISKINLKHNIFFSILRRFISFDKTYIPNEITYIINNYIPKNKKISYFIALLMYGLNDYKGEKKGLTKDIKLYRGLKMSYINLSFYERNIGNIITFPSLIS